VLGVAYDRGNASALRPKPLVDGVVCDGCASRGSQQRETTMPSPDGCFVRVWDGARFGGVTDYINGPRVYANLRDLPGGRIWSNRIRSAKTGVAASATVYADEDFQGASMRLMPDREYSTFPAELSGRIASMRVDCPLTAPRKAE
jgi:hypothetical protein